jgi:AraC-like DNA-binding protein
VDCGDLAHLRRARDLLDREYARPLDVPGMARAALMSPSHFARQFRAAFGETPYAYLQSRRLERAMALLRRGDMSVTDVCLAVGFTSLGSFSSTFSRLVGEPPSAYRDRDHASMAPVPACVARTWTRPGWLGPGGSARVAASPGQSRLGPSRAGWSRAGPSRAGPSRAGPSQAGPSQAGPSQAGPSQAGSEKRRGRPPH